MCVEARWKGRIVDDVLTTQDDAFSSFHPVLTFFYFLAIIGCSMFVMHPAVLTASLVGGVSYSWYLTRGASQRGLLAMMLSAMVLPALINPLFNHAGATVLFRLWWGAPVTFEAVAFGLCTGCMLASVVVWFACYRMVMTSDKTIYLFGKAVPALSLVFSMTLQFVPRFMTQFKRVLNAQRCMGRDVIHGTLRERTSTAAKTISIMATWALEGSIQTADSMRSRGYGLRGRTSYSPYRFDLRDRMAAAVVLVLVGLITYGLWSGGLEISFFPMINAAAPCVSSAAACGAFAVLCMFPLIVDGADEVRWRYLRSKI